MTFQTSGLPAGEAVTIWWIIIDPVDGLVSGQFAAGHVIGGSGNASFAGSLAEGDTSGCFHPLFPCHGLSDARGQTVLLLARVHGPKDPGRVPVQIHTAEATHGDPGFAGRSLQHGPVLPGPGGVVRALILRESRTARPAPVGGPRRTRDDT